MEPRRQMPASAGLHCRGHCRRDIAGAQDKVSDRGIAEQRCMGKPECSSGLPLLVLKCYPELHSGIPLGRLMNISLYKHCF
ncbi:unnamed protein product [Staurois parvus]|uniref:Uncharacterized protein n=1 Tax=Staurois parvus TaxID=386267 RepID=A0ABN9GT06_9NEOB|nr:unnamed protein product [Staurois parvus]